MAQARISFPPVVTADSWGHVWQHVFAAARKRGDDRAADGTYAPRLTNGELSALVRAWKEALTGAVTFPLWSPWGATAYRWNPKRPSVFVTTNAQRDSRIDTEVAKDFWLATARVASDLDDATPAARLEIDNGTFSDQVWQAEVKADLLADGAKVAWKVPLAACRDKDGKAKPARLGCKAGWDLVETSPGVFVCREKSTGRTESPGYVCEGEQIMVDDPITVLGQQLLKSLLILGALWLFLRDTKPGSRR